MKQLAAIVCLLFSTGSFAAQPILDSFLKNLTSLHAQFEQQLFNETGKQLETSQGQMYIKRPNQFRWDYQKPYQQLIVADGENVWIYDPDLEQVTMKKLTKALGKTPALLLTSNRPIEEDFFVNPLPAKADITRLELLPKDAQAQFDSIRLNFRGDTLLGFELVDNLGQTTLITFKQVERNQKLEESLFIFTPPAGVDVVTED
jgi:outer membrane lipoprotein carrier protein